MSVIDWHRVKSIMFVCHGNICRSTMAHCIMEKMLADAGIGHIRVDSSATSTEEIGNPIHPGAAAMLRRQGVPIIPHRARQLKAADLTKCDVFIGADSANLANMRRILGPAAEGRCLRLMSLLGEERDIADPWWTGDFQTTWDDISLGCAELLRCLTDTTKSR